MNSDSDIKQCNLVNSDDINLNEIVKNLNIVKKDLEADYINIQYANDEKMLDYYTYKIKSEEAKYDFLIKKAKEIEEI